MNKAQLDAILHRHYLWLYRSGGERGDLSGAILNGMNLENAMLSRVNFRGANLVNANLAGSILTFSDLRGADLSFASLRGADLMGANLTNVDFTHTDLFEAKGNFCIGAFGKHTAVAAGGFIVIGCERHSYDYWLYNAERMGRRAGYSSNEIRMYVDWIFTSVGYLRKVEALRC